MDREEAISYLERKGKIGEPTKEAEYDKEDEEEIETVMKRGRVYGDPRVEIF